MKNKRAPIFAALAGMLAAYAIRQVFYLNWHRLLPPAPEGWMQSREVTREFLAGLPFYLHLLNSLSYALAAFGGAALAIKLSPTGRYLPAFAVIVFLLYLYDWTVMYSLYPPWVMALDIAWLAAGAAAGLYFCRRWSLRHR